MKERPILFSGEMVRAILEGRKTQTRRTIKPQPIYKPEERDGGITIAASLIQPQGPQIKSQGGNKPPFGPNIFLSMFQKFKVGERLWVRETWAAWSSFESNGPDEVEGTSKDLIEQGLCQAHISYRADHQTTANRWRPSIFMPRWASRITLEITNVRVQRLDEISPSDAVAEGMAVDDAIHDYRCLWDSLNKKRGLGWDTNPWIWAITFRRVK